MYHKKFFYRNSGEPNVAGMMVNNVISLDLQKNSDPVCVGRVARNDGFL